MHMWNNCLDFESHLHGEILVYVESVASLPQRPLPITCLWGMYLVNHSAQPENLYGQIVVSRDKAGMCSNIFDITLIGSLTL